MNAGKLDRRVTLVSVVTVNGASGWTETTTDLGKVWAERRDVSDGEKAAAGTMQGTLASRFTVRSSTLTRSLKPKDRLVEGGLTFEIVGLKEKGRRDFIEITAQAILD